ncbi:MAG TPA: Ig-like domain-containing protein, partial [Kofleriaceae bacterium]|nr:Ig-like domain-containing protein [Kofleriaceae bacterium]
DAHPMFEATTIRLVFSEPLDPRTVVEGAGSVELLAGGALVPATVIAQGIHVSIDPRMDLTPGTTYQLRLGNKITDLGGRALAPVSFSLVPLNSRGTAGPIAQVLRTRQPGDPGPRTTVAGAEPNVIQLVKPLIGRESVTLLDSALAAELGDPKALGGPIAFTIRRGQRLHASGIDVKLGGQIPVGLSTGELQIELLTDAGGRMYRNPHQAAGQPPENTRAPLYVDLAMDVALYATDPKGNAVLAQTVLGIQAAGVAIPTEGVLAIETVASMDLGLLGVTEASSNLVLELITSPGTTVPVNAKGPSLVATYPAEGTRDLPVDAGIELVFDEPVDLDRARAGGVRLEDTNGTAVPAIIESHGSAIVVRPVARLAYGTDYRVLMSDVADLAGNRLASAATLRFATPQLVSTTVPMTVVAVSPGAPCALTGASGSSPGRCAGGLPSDDLYRPFELEQDRPVEVELSQPLQRSSATLGTACGAGSVRVEELSPGGGCLAAVPGTLIVRERGFSFVPDRPWTIGAHYRLALVSGPGTTCTPGELCGFNAIPARFDPLAGMAAGQGGGPNLLIDFTGVAPTGATALVARASPFTDINGSGAVETGEVPHNENRAALRITGTTGDITTARFTSPACPASASQTEACMYLLGSMPVAMGEVTTKCPLPGGASAPSCMPVTISPIAMYATSVSMEATILLTIPSSTNMTVMRLREPASGPITGYIIDGGGASKMVAALELYMDAPDLSLPLGTHNLHSKPLSVTLEGPVAFLPDGQIAITLSNTTDLPVEVMVTVPPPTSVSGKIQMIVPKNEMKLQLVSPAIRGVER